jgi:hypothetical protein
MIIVVAAHNNGQPVAERLSFFFLIFLHLFIRSRSLALASTENKQQRRTSKLITMNKLYPL